MTGAGRLDRRAILARLVRGETSVTDLAKPFAMGLPVISKHLKVLERGGLIVRSREAQWRLCRIEPQGLKKVDVWLEHYRRFFGESFDRLDDSLRNSSGQKGESGFEDQALIGPATIDRAAWRTKIERMGRAMQAMCRLSPAPRCCSARSCSRTAWISCACSPVRCYRRRQAVGRRRAGKSTGWRKPSPGLVNVWRM